MKLFIWPKSNILNLIKSLPIKKNNEEIENQFRDYYNGGFPVLCSSGRVAIMLILKSFLPIKNKKIGIFPFASTCVREAILKIADFSLIKQDINISYNQWGYQNAQKGSSYLIEDSADTLVEINTNIFANTKSNFIIWSLPNIGNSY